MSGQAPPPEQTEPIRVLVVDDDAVVRAGLRLILGSAADVQVVGEASGGTEVVDAVRRHRPDVVLMDVRTPLVNGLAATAGLTARPTGRACWC